MSASNRGPGRPAKFVELSNKGIFSLKDVFDLNAETNSQTVRERINHLVDTGVLTRLNKTVKTGGRGKPAALFASTAWLRNRTEARLAEKNDKAVVA